MVKSPIFANAKMERCSSGCRGTPGKCVYSKRVSRVRIPFSPQACRCSAGFICFRLCPIHPCEIIKEEVEYRNIKQPKLAEQMGISYKMLNDILICRRPLTTPTAMLFEAALGISAELLMRMQLDYNIQATKQDKSFIERLENVRKVAAVL